MASLFTAGKFQAEDATGPLPGALLYTYAAGTLTPLATYTDQGGGSSNTNPVVCDVNGQANVWAGPFAYRMILKTAQGVTVWDVDNIGAPVSTADLALSSGAAGIGFIQAGAGAVARTTQSKLRDEFNVKDFGALSTNTNAANKVCLQLAITAASVAGGGTVIVPFDIGYGHKVSDKTTWPSFSGVTSPLRVHDFGPGSSYAGFPTAYDGAQARIWSFTPQTTSPGQHDGNTQWLRSAWAPNYVISNDMDLSGSRAATDNRRALMTYMVNGTATWAMGQGVVSSNTLSDEELSNFTLQKYNRTGDTLAIDYAPLVIERKTSYMAYGVGTNAPEAHHHFGRVTGSVTAYIAKFKSNTTSCDVVVEESSSANNAWSLRNTSGLLELVNIGNGSAFSIDSTLRRVTTGRSLAQTRIVVTYSNSMTIDAATGNIFSITGTNGTAFTINAPTNPASGQAITVTVRNTSGGALGAATWNGAFKMVAWTNPANGFSRSINFYYDGANWIETFRSAADVGN